MRSVFLISAVLTAFIILEVEQAAAWSTDDKSMNGSNASTFDDPDDKTPAGLFSSSASRNNLQGKENSSTGAVDPSTVKYNYDPSSGNYYPAR